MEKKTIAIQGLKTAYYDTETSLPTVLFIHGNSLSADTFKNQFEDKALTSRFRLIAIDLPGHGDTEHARQPEKMYSMQGFINFITEFITTLDQNETILVGHSLGGHILLNSYKHIAKYTSGLVIFGTPPFMIPPRMNESNYEHPALRLAFNGQLTDEEVHEMALSFISKTNPLPPVILESIKSTDQAMRQTLGASITPESIPNEAEIIKNIAVPIAIFHGKGDQLIKHTYFELLTIPKLWNGEVQLIENAGHSPQLEAPEEFNQLLSKFILDD